MRARGTNIKLGKGDNAGSTAQSAMCGADGEVKRYQALASNCRAAFKSKYGAKGWCSVPLHAGPTARQRSCTRDGTACFVGCCMLLVLHPLPQLLTVQAQARCAFAVFAIHCPSAVAVFAPAQPTKDECMTTHQRTPSAPGLQGKKTQCTPQHCTHGVLSPALPPAIDGDGHHSMAVVDKQPPHTLDAPQHACATANLPSSPTHLSPLYPVSVVQLCIISCSLTAVHVP